MKMFCSPKRNRVCAQGLFQVGFGFFLNQNGSAIFESKAKAKMFCLLFLNILQKGLLKLLVQGWDVTFCCLWGNQPKLQDWKIVCHCHRVPSSRILAWDHCSLVWSLRASSEASPGMVFKARGRGSHYSFPLWNSGISVPQTPWISVALIYGVSIQFQS